VCSAYALSGRILIEQSRSGTEAEKRKAYGQALELLKKAIAGGMNTPEAREAGNQLVEVYTKLGLVKEAEQLKAEIDSKGTGSPSENIPSQLPTNRNWRCPIC
jgi:outer membrane protein assembly factor BamD (BamD/ComL family)